MRPLLSYYGGKQRLASWLLSLLPPHTVYVEPFAGGAALLFAKPRPFVSSHDQYREVLNDRDERIITVYRAVQEPSTRQALYERLMTTPYSRAEHRRSREIQRHWADADVVSRAWAIIVDVQQSFSNSIGRGWRTSIYGSNQAATWHGWQGNLDAIFERLQGVHLECDDALAVMQRWDSPQTCLYIEPPYVGADQCHYAGWTVEDQRRLIACLESLNSSFVLSGYDHPEIRVPCHWQRYEHTAWVSASGKAQTRGHDRTRKATTAELSDRHRIDVAWVVDRSYAVRPELRWIRMPQLALWEEKHDHA
ncbi:MAG TPA: DNA adenine methylase [Alphaproteobacteria bacterium]|nr:DNA adenine methylase [Alphaproteobacteria bacterium]